MPADYHSHTPLCHHAEGSSTRPGGVYVDNSGAFEIFIATGGNVGMYKAVHAALRAAWAAAAPTGRPWTLLDVGTGSGLGLLPLTPTLSLKKGEGVFARQLP